MYTDACDYGYGAIFGDAWIQGAFEGKHKEHSIDFKELFALVAAVFNLGIQLEREAGGVLHR